MDPKRNCSERMRPILQAMERSIENARRNRTNQPAEPPRPQTVVPRIASPFVPAPTVPSTSVSATEHPAQRLKARPKRLENPALNSFEQMTYRSRAS